MEDFEEFDSEISRYLKDFSTEGKEQVYLLRAPLLCKDKYEMSTKHFIIAIPGRKIILGAVEEESKSFRDYCDDVIDDLSMLSKTYSYENVIGRPRLWENTMFLQRDSMASRERIAEVLEESRICGSERDRRISSLLVSLAIGSINDVKDLRLDPGSNLLQKVRQKIVLYDGDQSRFIYRHLNKPRIVIQGLAGTGKTELLLHKLRELYTDHPNGTNNRIFFTCYNKVLADQLRQRIPIFFDSMKVNEQIAWDTRLFVAASWGSFNDPCSGLYRYACFAYNIPFLNYKQASSLDVACRRALNEIPEDARPCLDYILVDESQDFPASFFDLCERMASKSVYIAGDIFQDIFQVSEASTVEVDYLLNKCYRTDPRTLLFAHALGFGLCETPIIRWLTPEDWAASGYEINALSDDKVRIMRQPVNRLGLQEGELTDPPISIRYTTDFESEIISIIREIKAKYPEVSPGDIAIIFPGKTNPNYAIADKLQIQLHLEFGWNSTKGYESKHTDSEAVYISNRYNIKGLEFPFVICYAIGEISNSLALRNALYMILTRSFLSSYLVVNAESPGAIAKYDEAAKHLETHPYLDVRLPTQEEIKRQEESLLQHAVERKSLLEIIDECLENSSSIFPDRYCQ